MTETRRRPDRREIGPLLRGLLAGSLTLVAAAALSACLSSAESIPPGPDGAAPLESPLGFALRLDGKSALRIEATSPLRGEHGAFTLECRVRGATPLEQAAIAGNRHYGGFGLTWSHPDLAQDRPTGWVNVSHVPGTRHSGYLLLRPARVWSWGRTTHLALTFDGRRAQLFVDGEPVSEAVTPGRSRESKQPFIVGGDPYGSGEPSAFFTGEIDDLRISRVARYDRTFTPPRAYRPDADTTLLLDFEDATQPFRDRSPLASPVTVFGTPRRVPAR